VNWGRSKEVVWIAAWVIGLVIGLAIIWTLLCL
jgi:hypothetical protein